MTSLSNLIHIRCVTEGRSQLLQGVTILMSCTSFRMATSSAHATLIPPPIHCTALHTVWNVADVLNTLTQLMSRVQLKLQTKETIARGDPG
jgi:hypothetical protein